MRRSLWKLGSRGSALVEVMFLMMVFLVFSTSILASSAAVNRRAIRRKERNEAYYAAVAAAQMVKGEWMGESGMPEVFKDRELEETRGTIMISTSDGVIQIPIWLTLERREDGRALLKAEAMVGEQKSVVFIEIGLPFDEGTADLGRAEK